MHVVDRLLLLTDCSFPITDIASSGDGCVSGLPWSSRFIPYMCLQCCPQVGYNKILSKIIKNNINYKYFLRPESEKCIAASVGEGHTYSGAKVRGICDKLKLFARDKKYFSKISIIAGSNDCSVNSCTTDFILEDMREALECATKIAEKVCLSSILPRTDIGAAQLKAENINPRLREMCTRMPKVAFVDHDHNFRLADKTPNTSFLDADGLHLSQQGCEALDLPALYRTRRQYSSYPPRAQSYRHKPVFTNNQQWNYQSSQSNGFSSHPAPQTTSSDLYFPNAIMQRQHFNYGNSHINSSVAQQPQSQYSSNRHPTQIPDYQPIVCNRCGMNHATSMCMMNQNVSCGYCISVYHTTSACGNYLRP